MRRTHVTFIVFALLAWSAALPGQTMNSLTAQEKGQGWQLLFDGKTLTGWHSSAPPQGRGQGQGQGRAAGAPQPAQVQPGALPAVEFHSGAVRHRVKGTRLRRAGRRFSLGSRGRIDDGVRGARRLPDFRSRATRTSFSRSSSDAVRMPTAACSSGPPRKAAATKCRFGDCSRPATTPEPLWGPRRPRGITGSIRTSGIVFRSPRRGITSWSS